MSEGESGLGVEAFAAGGANYDTSRVRGWRIARLVALGIVYLVGPVWYAVQGFGFPSSRWRGWDASRSAW